MPSMRSLAAPAGASRTSRPLATTRSATSPARPEPTRLASCRVFWQAKRNKSFAKSRFIGLAIDERHQPQRVVALRLCGHATTLATRSACTLTTSA